MKQSDTALDFEVAQSVLLAKSERRAWMVAGSLGVVTVIALLAVALLVPLKTVEPYLVSVDKNSGHTQLITALDSQTHVISSQEAVNNYWVANYLRWREVYDWYTLQDDYNMTRLLSSAPVRTEYESLFEGEDALDTRWGKRIKAGVRIVSIVNDLSLGIATVRFEKAVKLAEERGEGEITAWVATIKYQFADRDMTQDERLKNRWGLRC
ncbi:inner membrane protein forms channel for type IV secretion of T-DNA complex VirB8 [Vibrio astriarenae]|nr:inner membrane protein forms channel for type IV secretion of T-DNA complex VirB8 [Vibrio sp. C7]